MLCKIQKLEHNSIIYWSNPASCLIDWTCLCFIVDCIWPAMHSEKKKTKQTKKITPTRSQLHLVWFYPPFKPNRMDNRHNCCCIKWTIIVQHFTLQVRWICKKRGGGSHYIYTVTRKQQKNSHMPVSFNFIK